MIKQPNELTFTDKKFSMIIYGSPGLGKTTLALSTPTPVLIDFDRGISRVKAYHRKLTIVCSTYEEVLKDIQSPEIKDCQTIVIDTGGSFITFLKDWAMRTQPGCKTKTGEFHGMKGFGVVKTEFANFTEHIKTVLNKNVIYVFHSVEQTDKDGNSQQRLMCEGSTKNTVWNPCDFGGYMQMLGNQRVICFTPEDEFFAKGTHGIEGRIPIPTLLPDVPNDFITKIFEKARQNIESESDAFAPMKEKYEQTMAKVTEIINEIQTAEDATAAATVLPLLEHALTSKKEALGLLTAKASALGLVWDKNDKAYKPVEAK